MKICIHTVKGMLKNLYNSSGISKSLIVNILNQKRRERISMLVVKFYLYFKVNLPRKVRTNL